MVRILDGTYGGANATIQTSGSVNTSGVNTATGSINFTSQSLLLGSRFKITQGTDTFTFIASADGGGDA